MSSKKKDLAGAAAARRERAALAAGPAAVGAAAAAAVLLAASVLRARHAGRPGSGGGRRCFHSQAGSVHAWEGVGCWSAQRMRE